MDAGRPVITIEGTRVALGPLRRDLIPAYNRWRNDFAVQLTYGGEPRPVPLEATTAWFEARVESDDARWFTVYDRDGWRPIGQTDIWNIDHRHGSCRFGMLIGEGSDRGRGFGTETTVLMLDYAFAALNLGLVTLEVDAYNEPAIRAYTRAGFREVGRWREATVVNGVRSDLLVMTATPATATPGPVSAIFRIG